MEPKVNNSKKICNGGQKSQYYFNQNTKGQSNAKKREQNLALESEGEQQQDLLPFSKIMLIRNMDEGLSLLTQSYFFVLTLLENGRRIFMTWAVLEKFQAWGRNYWQKIYGFYREDQNRCLLLTLLVSLDLKMYAFKEDFSGTHTIVLPCNFYLSYPSLWCTSISHSLSHRGIQRYSLLPLSFSNILHQP